MKNFFFLSITIALLQSNLLAQAPEVQWQKSIGGSGFDFCRAMVQAADGGYILAGNTESVDGDIPAIQGGTDVWVLKLDTTQNIVWQTNIGGSLNEDFSVMIATNDGGYLIGGREASSDGDFTGLNFHGMTEAWLAKLNSEGDLQWIRLYGGSQHDQIYGIAPTPDNGFICIGLSSSNDGDVSGNHGDSDYWVMKTDASGNLQWQKSYGGSSSDIGFYISLTSDGGYIMTGQCGSSDGDVTGHHPPLDTMPGKFDDAWVVKTDASGNIQWQRSLGGTRDDYSLNIIQVADGNYVLAARAQSGDGDATFNHGGYDLWMVKLDQNGNIIWQKSYGGSGDEYAASFIQTSAGDYIVYGRTLSNDGDVSGSHGLSDYWITRITPDGGSLEWQKCYGGSGDDATGTYCFDLTSDGGYIIGGRSDSNDGDISGNHGDFDWNILKLGPDCPPPASSSVSKITSSSAKVNWPAVPGVSSYKIRYRVSGTSVWTKRNASTTSKRLTGLTPSTTYEYQLASKCGDAKVIWSASSVFTTLPLRLSNDLSGSENDFTIYPNPAENVITIQFDNAIPKQIIISDISGKVTRVIDVHIDRVAIDISQLAPGTYLISAEYSNGMHRTQKLIKEYRF